MSVRKSIANALVTKLKEIDGTEPYLTNIFGNAEAKLRFWDEVSDFPSLFVVPGPESREYLPGGFKWSLLSLSIKVYVKGEDPQDMLENILEDIEKCIDLNNVMPYSDLPGKETTEMRITSITTDEGLLAPYGVGEINLQVQYQVL